MERKSNIRNGFNNIYGIAVSTAIAVPAFFLGKCFTIIGGAVFAIILGILMAGIKRPAILENGIKFTSKKILQYSIILIGFEMNMISILTVGKESIVVMLFTISGSLLTAFVLGRILKLHGNTAILIGVGTSICGGSAIAATAPVIDADDQDIAYSISTIFLFNIIAVFIFPAIGRIFGMSDSDFGLFAGTAINDTSSVVAAGYTFSSAAGNYATIVKLTRTLMIIPITLILAIYRSSKAKNQEKGNSSVSGSYSIVKIFPWFVIGFLLTAILNTTGIIPAYAASFFNFAGRFGIIMAMAAIGLNTNLKKLVSNGFRPILLGLGCWFVVTLISLTFIIQI